MKKAYHKTWSIPVEGILLSGEVILPADTTSLVLFSHGSGSSRFSTRNNFVAGVLNTHGIGTFLFDLLTPQEDQNYMNRFNIGMLTNRLISITRFISSQKEFAHLNLGYFGASTGAASALRAAAVLPGLIHAIVSRGGRPDLALARISEVQAPTLLIVGEKDTDVIEMNTNAYRLFNCPRKMIIIPGASHLFEEAGTLEQVAGHASDWFNEHLVLENKLRDHVVQR